MKSIGWCLEKIQETVNTIPKQVQTKQEQQQARNVLKHLEAYTCTLAEIITNAGFSRRLQVLKNAKNTDIQLQAQHLEELREDLEHICYLLETYHAQLQQMLEERSPDWTEKATMITAAIHEKFGDEYGELRKEFEESIHSQEELERIISSQKHLAALLQA